MRVEHLYVHCIHPDRPDGTLFEGGLEVVPNGEHDTPDVIEKVSGERLCSLPLYRTKYLDRLVKDGRLSYGVVRVGPWRRKEWLPTRLEVVLKDDLNELASDLLLEKLRDALMNDV